MHTIRSGPAVLFATIGLLASGGMALAQTPPANPPPPSDMSSDSSKSSQPVKSKAGKKQDQSRGAKEQTSQQRKCPKNGDNTNVNCKPSSDTQDKSDKQDQ